MQTSSQGLGSSWYAVDFATDPEPKLDGGLFGLRGAAAAFGRCSAASSGTQFAKPIDLISSGRLIVCADHFSLKARCVILIPGADNPKHPNLLGGAGKTRSNAAAFGRCIGSRFAT